MFSISKIATFATLTLGAFSSAVAVPATEKRQSTDAVSVLNDLATNVAPIANQLATITADNATSDNIQPIVDQMTSMVSDAVDQLSAIPNGTTINGDAVGALGNVFNAIFTPANTLISTEGVDVAGIAPIFTQLGNTLAQLLQNVVRLVQEVLELVVQILQGLIIGLSGVLSGLNLTALTNLGL